MFPEQASTFAPLIDRTFTFIFVITMGMVVLVTVLMIVFAVRYRRSKSPRGANIPSNLALEVTWVVIPSLLVTAIFFYGWREYQTMRTVPPGAMVVRVTAKQWAWSFAYDSGKTSRDLRVPIGRPVKLVLHSEDVIHSLYIPAFRVKEDVVPGMETYLWFQAQELGSYHLFCAEYCGEGHAAMTTQVVVLTEAEFRAWGSTMPESTALTPGGEGSPGYTLLEEKGCSGCHSVDGLHGVGPTLKGLYGHTVRVLIGGKERDVTADEEYLRRSILEPEAEIVRGFQPIMPSFKGKLTEEELGQIVDTIKFLR